MDVFYTGGKRTVSKHVTCSSIFMFVTRRLWSLWGPRFDPRLIFLWELKNQTRNRLDNWRAPLPPSDQRGMIICLDVHIRWFSSYQPLLS